MSNTVPTPTSQQPWNLSSSHSRKIVQTSVFEGMVKTHDWEGCKDLPLISAISDFSPLKSLKSSISSVKDQGR